MAQLGTLTAGVAHELNNPASAIRRSAAHLQDELRRLSDAHAEMYALSLSKEDFEDLSAQRRSDEERARDPTSLDPLERADREEAFEVWLAEYGVPEPWSVSSTLARTDYELDDLQKLADRFQGDALSTVIRWMDATCSAGDLLSEITQASERIADIVSALKSYSYLDQAPVQEVDVHRGLDDTLLILRSRLVEGVIVTREYDLSVPTIQAYGSELNQVWTNLLDNATYAVRDGGNVWIRTRSERDCVVVEIEDDGPGIPKEIQGRIFDPFFTTKPLGEGTGLGLEISYGIVVNRHRGDIEVESQPGRTCFEVWLPVDPRSSE